jgi:glycosyltransferase involved in cell wall biosynthesis
MVYLSICIPTYNRSTYLINTIESIITQQEFQLTDEVEIVVSDNCSTDNTQDVMNNYVSKYPNKIRYTRNTENILDKNYEKVLSYANGEVLKLHNDTLTLDKNSLCFLLEVSKYCIETNTMPFLLNGNLNHISQRYIYNDVNSFLKDISYHCTWIGSFCILRNDFLKFDDFSKKSNLLLTQVYVLMEYLNKKKSILIVPEKYATSITPSQKGGYNIVEIFYINYINILTPYFQNSAGLKVLKREKMKILYWFILPWIVRLDRDKRDGSEKYSFEFDNFFNIIKSKLSTLEYSFFIIYYFAYKGYFELKCILNKKS